MATIKVSAKLKGVDKLELALKKYAGKVEEAIPAALYQVAEQIMNKAKRLTPVDTGALRSSGHVVPPYRDGRKIVIEMGFGGPAGRGNLDSTNDEDVGYAVYVHEDMTAHHVVGQAKYLEEPLNAAVVDIPNLLAKRIRSMASHGTP